MANIFTARKDEFISGTGFYTTDNNAEYEITVYTDLKDMSDPASGIPNTPQKGTEKYAGYHTISLNDPVKVTEGEIFSVVVSLKNPGTNCPIPVEAAVVLMENRFAVNVSEISEEEIENGSEECESFISVNGTRWTDTKGLEIEDVYNNPKMPDSNIKYYVGNVCLKAFGSDGISEPDTSGKESSVLSSLTVNKKEIAVCNEYEEPVTELYTELSDGSDTMALAASGTGKISVNGRPVVSGHTSEPFELSYGKNIFTITSEEDGLTPVKYTLTVVKNRAYPDYRTETIIFDEENTKVTSARGHEFFSGESISDYLGTTLTVTEPEREYTIDLEPRRDLAALMNESSLYMEGEVITGLFDLKGTVNYSYYPDMSGAMDIHTRMTSLLGENAFRVYPGEDTDLYFQTAADDNGPASTIWHIHIPSRPTITTNDIRVSIPWNNTIQFTPDYAEDAAIQYRLVMKYKNETPAASDLFPYETAKNGDVVWLEDLMPGQTYSLYFRLISNGRRFASDVSERVIQLPGGQPVCSFHTEKECVIFNEKKYTATAPDGRELKCYDRISDYCGKDIILTEADGTESAVLVPLRPEAPRMELEYSTGKLLGTYYSDSENLCFLVNSDRVYDSTPINADTLMDKAGYITLDKIFSSSYRPGDTLYFFYRANENYLASEVFAYTIPSQRITPESMLRILNYTDHEIELAAGEGLEYGIRENFRDEYKWSDDPHFTDLLAGHEYITAVRTAATETEPFGTTVADVVTTLPYTNNPGDLNGDENINAIDVIILKRILLMSIIPDPVQKFNADMNSDGSVNIFDLQRISETVISATEWFTDEQGNYYR
ncbi:lectin like domain-containing protein [Ruminococcus sp. HUN007]|uniref:lectin like domain-containing protein n=1 Tax=Ruminococcus sp. HUN007 TaxID=1514668 RepID=UPI0005D22835|nr:lectin like domain-containing protein [Ruminococcus sp. HUN007]